MKHIHNITDAVAGGSGALGRADARVKLMGALVLIALVLGSSGPAFPTIVFVTFSVASMLAGVTPLTLILRFAEPAFMVLILCTIKLFFSGHKEAFSFTVSGIQFIGHSDGLREGLLIVSRVMGAVSVMALVGFTTTFTEVIGALGYFKVPRDFIEILTFAYRFIFVLFEEAWTIYTAQKNRMGYVGLTNGLRSFGTLCGALVLKVFDHTTQTAAALRQRGYEGVLPLYEGRSFRTGELLLAASILCASGGLWKLLQG